jgi:hypothetical protein
MRRLIKQNPSDLFLEFTKSQGFPNDVFFSDNGCLLSEIEFRGNISRFFEQECPSHFPDLVYVLYVKQYLMLDTDCARLKITFYKTEQ